MPISRSCLGSALRPDCNRDVTPPASRCAECQNATRRARRNPGYDDPRYRARRKNVRSRICQGCRRTNAETVHHEDGDPRNNHDSNLTDLCTACAREADRLMRTNRRAQRRV